MRCSFSEARLDAYVEGELAPRDRALVAAHVETCEACASLLAELRVIDALLITPRTLEPAPNFTFKVMAEVRCLPQPHVHRVPTFAVLGTYVVFAWVTIGAFLIFARPAARATLAAIEAWLVHLGATAGSIASAVEHVFGRQSVGLTAAMAGLLAADVAAAAAVYGLYAFLRARRTVVPAEGEPC
jgi:anti-sigma factor RsiW